MLGIVFSLDYEINGNGQGSPYKLIVDPTAKMLKLFDKYDAKLTILADIAEIMKYYDYFKRTGEDRFFYSSIEKQLQYAYKNNHDIQLHIHSSFFNSEYIEDHWEQDWSEYNLAGLSYERINTIINTSKQFLQNMINSNDQYNCFVFRAANWSMSPSGNISKALINNGFLIDTSVFKNGTRAGLVNFDYSYADSNIVPWPVNINNICLRDSDGALFEFPIYSEKRGILHFLSINRLYRVIFSLKNHLPSESQASMNKDTKDYNKIRGLFKNKHSWKLDFNQCSSSQIIKTLKRISEKYDSEEKLIPIVLIGHSKLFTHYNKLHLERVLKYISRNPDLFNFSTFNDFNLEDFR